MSELANPAATLIHIIQSAAQAESGLEQMQQIVDNICDTLQMDVCSLYLRQRDDSFLLLASRGLKQLHPVMIPPGQGLVGQVLNNKQPLLITEPQQHPAFFHVSDSDEEQFHSFAGMPLIYRGVVKGVLVVQRLNTELPDAAQQALLSTLAIHLALIINSGQFSLPSVALEQKNVVHQGISGAQGLAIGKARLVQQARLADVSRKEQQDSDAEEMRWQLLKQRTMSELEQEKHTIREQMGEGLAAVIDAYQLMLLDPGFEAMLTQEVRQGAELSWALRKTIEFFSEQFRALPDPYLQARAEDVCHLGEKLYQVLQGESLQRPDSDNQEPLVLVGEHISVSDIANLAAQELAAIVCFEGAALSHIAVFANALGIPAIMGVGRLALNNGDLLVVDGDNGDVVTSVGKNLLREYRRLIRERQQTDARLVAESKQPCVSLDGQAVALLANSGLQADAEPGLRYGAEGIGLFRTEVPFMVRASLPSEQEQADIYAAVLRQYQGKPVYMRTLDIGSDKPLPYLPTVQEENPALGLRGVRYTLDNPALLTIQLRAMLRAADGNDQLRLLLPMIGSSGQLDECLQLLDDALQALRQEGLTVVRPLVGIMVEVPSAIALLPKWRNKIDFISVGTNDLSQYLLAIDRNNSLVSRWYDALHPAVLLELQRIVSIAATAELPVSVCGELAADPQAVVLLLGMGIRQLSMSAAKIPAIKYLIRHLTVSQCQQLFEQACELDDASAIRALLQAFIDQQMAAGQ